MQYGFGSEGEGKEDLQRGEEWEFEYRRGVESRDGMGIRFVATGGLQKERTVWKIKGKANQTVMEGCTGKALQSGKTIATVAVWKGMRRGMGKKSQRKRGYIMSEG